MLSNNNAIEETRTKNSPYKYLKTSVWVFHRQIQAKPNFLKEKHVDIYSIHRELVLFSSIKIPKYATANIINYDSFTFALKFNYFYSIRVVTT